MKPELTVVTSKDVPSPGGEESQPAQTEMPFAVVSGEPVTELPQDLYIPPYALKVFLEAFEGPLDLLLYLIRRQNLDVLDIPIAEITKQYVEYIELMKEMQLELAGEYLVMAAMLAEIKSRMLLPRPVAEDSDEHDPRAELVRRLQEYERFKKAATDMDGLPRVERDITLTEIEQPPTQTPVKLPDITLKELLVAFQDVLIRAEMYASHHVSREPLSVRQRMSEILSRVQGRDFADFSTLFVVEEGRMGVAVTFIAILELIKESLIEIVQSEPYAPIHVRSSGPVLVEEAPDAGTDDPESAYADDSSESPDESADLAALNDPEPSEGQS